MKAGRTAIITGSNRGIGMETARALALRKYTVVMACRDSRSAGSVRDAIRTESGNVDVHVLELDLASFTSIEAFVAMFLRRFGQLNILVNNAGTVSRRDGMTKDGLEKTVGTNYFGTCFLTKLLIPHFARGEDDRIVNLCSDIYRYGRFSLDRLNGYHWVKAYAVSKYLILLFTLELAGRLSESGIAVNAVHPGIVRTTIMMTGRWYDAIIDLLLKPLYVDTVEGAKTVVYLASADEARGQTGHYYKKGMPAGIQERYRDEILLKQVWTRSEAIIEEIRGRRGL